MPNSYTELYFPVLVQALLAMALAAGLLSVSFLLGKKVRNRVKDMPYESGIDTYGDPHGRFGLSFYIYALLFVAFDIEVVFIYLWAIVFRDLLLGGFVSMLIFVAILLLGLAYAWRKGVLTWR